MSVALGGWIAACGSSDNSEFPNGGNGDGGNNGDGSDPDVSFGNPGLNDGSAVAPVNDLVFDPPTQTLTLDGTTAGTASYKLTATLLDGSKATVIAQSLQFDRPDVASAKNGDPVVLTVPGTFAGTGKIHAVYGGREATATLVVTVHRRDLGGVDPGAATALDNATAADPSLTALRYPYDKTVFPLGLTSPLVMWNAPAAAQVYRLRVEETNYVYDTYASVPALGQFRIDQAIWDRLTASSGGGADPMKVTLSRYDGTKAYVSAKETWSIATASLRGAIYYWTASKLTDGTLSGHISRIRPGSGAQPEKMKTGQTDEAQCMGCHAVSADGTTLAASVDIAPTGDPATYPYTKGGPGRAWASFNLPDGTVRKQTKLYGGDLALTPDGKYTVFGGVSEINGGQPVAGSKYITLGDTATGTPIATSGLDAVAVTAGRGLQMPAFSPDGKWLVAIESVAGNLRDNVTNDGAQILVIPFDEPTTKFGPTTTRLPLGDYTPFTVSGLGYPSFTPDSASVAFHVGNHPTGCFKDNVTGGNCDDNVHHQGNIFLQGTNGTAAPVRLAALDDGNLAADKNLSVEPTFNPIQRGGYSWVVFTSMRDWGNKLTGDPINGKRRLWVAAVDGTTGAVDPSHPAFYLEGQEDTPNMRGFWTLAACTATPPAGGAGGTCQAGFECCSGFCDRGACVDVSTAACSSLGGTCETSADCCNGSNGAVECLDHVCAIPPVK